MIKEEILDELISQYYDNQMNDSERISFEARLVMSDGIRNYTNKQCFEYFKLSNSIKLVKYRNSQKSNMVSKEFQKIINKKSIININTVGFEGFYKHLRHGFLNILRNNPE